MNHGFQLLALLLFLYCSNVGWCWQWCYVCSEDGKDGSCQKSPVDASTSAKAINCTSKFCTTVMVTYKDGETRSFARLCENIDRGNWCLHDSFLTTCYLTCKSHFCNNRVPDARYLPSGGHFGPLPTIKKPKTAVNFNRHKASPPNNEWSEKETVEHEEPTNSVFRPRKFPSMPSQSIRIQPKEKKSIMVKVPVKPTVPYRGPSYRYLGNSNRSKKTMITTTTTTNAPPTKTTTSTNTEKTSLISVRSDKQKSMTSKPSKGTASKSVLSGYMVFIIVLVYPFVNM